MHEIFYFNVRYKFYRQSEWNKDLKDTLCVINLYQEHFNLNKNAKIEAYSWLLNWKSCIQIIRILWCKSTKIIKVYPSLNFWWAINSAFIPKMQVCFVSIRKDWTLVGLKQLFVVYPLPRLNYGAEKNLT